MRRPRPSPRSRRGPTDSSRPQWISFRRRLGAARGSRAPGACGFPARRSAGARGWSRRALRVPWVDARERNDDMNGLSIAIAVIAVSGLLLLAAAIRVFKQYERGVQFRLGKLKDGPRGPGLVLIIPIIDRIHRVSLRIVTMPIQSQGIITRDNVSVDIAAVAYYRIRDAVALGDRDRGRGGRDQPDRPDDPALGRRPAHARRDARRDREDQPAHSRDPRRPDRGVGCRGDAGRAQGHPAAGRA